MKINDGVKVLVVQSCLTLCDPMDCGPPDFSVDGILQERILEGIAIPFSRGSSQLRKSLGFQHCRWILYCLCYQGGTVLTVKERSVRDNRVKIFQLLLSTIFVS